MNSKKIERYLNPFLKLTDSDLINLETMTEFIDDF